MTASYSAAPTPYTRRDAAGRCQDWKPKFARADIDRAEPGSVMTAMPQVTPNVVVARSKETIELTKPMTSTCQSGWTTTHFVEPTSACDSTWSTFPDPRSCAISYYAYLYCATSCSSVHRTSCTHTDVASRCQGWGVRFTEATTTKTHSSHVFNSSRWLSGGPTVTPTTHTKSEGLAPTYTSNDMSDRPPNGRWMARFASPGTVTEKGVPPHFTAEVNKRDAPTHSITSCASGYSAVPSTHTDWDCFSHHGQVSCSALSTWLTSICTSGATAFATPPHSTSNPYSPTRSNPSSSSTSSPPWSNTLPVDPVPTWTKTRSNIQITNSPIPTYSGPNNVARAFPTCSFDVTKGEYVCPNPTAGEAPVPTCYFDPAKGEYVCPKPPMCYFDPAKGEYICPTPAAAVDAAAPVPTCYFDPAKGQYVCPKPPTCYFDPKKGEYICPKPVDGKSEVRRSTFTLSPPVKRY
jgi:hypothetical protein